MSVAGRPVDSEPREAVKVTNRNGASPYVIICEHASNFIPVDYGALGLEEVELSRHIAWDPGALPVAGMLAEALDAPLVASTVSRLVIDCNRPLDAPDLVPETSETTVIPDNRGLDQAARAERVAISHQPFHAVLDELVTARLAAGRAAWLVTIHTFTPVYRSVPRPWHVGILHDADERLAGPMIAAFGRLDGVVVGDNQPYSPADRVYYTLERHGRSRGLPCAMVEIRNDGVGDADGQRLWAERLAAILADIEAAGLSEMAA
jgi:predicted N-formylglutamate amidohydrolase